MLLLQLLCGKKWANESCLGPNPQFAGNRDCSALKCTARVGNNPVSMWKTACRIQNKKKIKKSCQAHKNKFKCF